jgi:hypothetical protein
MGLSQSSRRLAESIERQRCPDRRATGNWRIKGRGRAVPTRRNAVICPLKSLMIPPSCEMKHGGAMEGDDRSDARASPFSRAYAPQEGRGAPAAQERERGLARKKGGEAERVALKWGQGVPTMLGRAKRELLASPPAAHSKRSVRPITELLP